MTPPQIIPRRDYSGSSASSSAGVVSDATLRTFEPLVDAAIEDGRLAYESRETTLLAAEIAPDLIRDQLEHRTPDSATATRNYYAKDGADDAYTRDAAGRLGTTAKELI